MKHNLTITFLLLAAFLVAQFLGLLIVNNYIDPIRSMEEGKTIFKELPIGERPPVEEGTSFIPIILTILLGTGLLLLLLKYNLEWIWKLWFALAIIMALTVSFQAFVISEVAFALALIFGIWKIFKPNLWVQTLTELFIYGGLAAIFVPIFNLWSIVILLILISIYDAYAVLKSKHMITLAQSQTKLKIFAGLLIPYQLPKKSTFTSIKETNKEINKKISTEVGKEAKRINGRKSSGASIQTGIKTAMLGGGDIGFPLIFAGVILKEFGLKYSLIIPFFAMLGLAFLLWWGDEKKFYPAMPFITVGCFLGLAVIELWMFLA